MEGSKSRYRRLSLRSLRLRLILSFALIGCLAGITAGAWSYVTIRQEAERFIDEELSQIAAIVINYDMLIPKRWEGPRHRHERMFMRFGHKDAPNAVPSLSDIDVKRFDIIIAPLIGRAGEKSFIPISVEDGFYTVLIANQRVRVFVASKLNGQRFVVARPFDSIEEISSKSLTTSAIEFAALFLFYILLAILAVNVMFRAVDRIARELSARKEDDLSPISLQGHTDVPSELDAFIEALNGLFKKTDDSIRSKKRFIADAAHEMRTPLTALSLQAENLLSCLQSREAGSLPPELVQKVSRLQQGIARERELMNALLTLARLQNNQAEDRQCFAVKDLFIELLEDLGPVADSKDIDLGLTENCAEVRICAVRSDVKTVLYNLTSNALKYAPASSQADLGCTVSSDGVELFVSDEGPGIAPEDLQSVFEPFFRVKGDRAEQHEGTGLGLAIAKAAADRAGGQVILRNRDTGGLYAALRLPSSMLCQDSKDKS